MREPYETARRDFLLYAVFGGERNPFRAASRLAYRDFCRTLRLKPGQSEALRAQADAVLETAIGGLLAQGALPQEHFDARHLALCLELKAIYRGGGVGLTIGQAQKWVNMAFKYLFIQAVPEVEALLPALHVPIDNYIMAAAGKLGVAGLGIAWSKLDDEAAYLRYQRDIRSRVAGPPLIWELTAWLDENRRLSAPAGRAIVSRETRR